MESKPVEHRFEQKQPMNRVFLFDLDDTLLNCDKFLSDYRRELRVALGSRNASAYWNIVQKLHRRLGYEDYFLALQRYRDQRPHDIKPMRVCLFLLGYPFTDLVFPRALDLLKRICHAGDKPVLFSEGESVFQTLKIERSGIADAVEGRLLIYDKKARELKSVARVFPAREYVMVDDDAHALRAAKKFWGERVTTVLVSEDVSASTKNAERPADLVVSAVGDLLRTDLLAPHRRR